MESNELMVTGNQNLYVSPVVGIEEAKSKFDLVRNYTAKCLTKDIDYGKLPGVSKPSLLKPGAEKICSLFGLSPKFTCVDKIMNWNGEGNPDNEPFFYFEYRCDLYRGGEFVASCDGSCNSWEKKYRYRNGDLRCPVCGKATVYKSKKDDGYFCWTKKGGCGANFAGNDTRITTQQTGTTKNYDTAEQVNTFQKMAQKRAFVGATLIACNLSEYYTQDVEDMDRSSFIPELEMVEGEYIPVEQPQRQKEQPKQKFDPEKWLMEEFSTPSNVMKMSYNNAKQYSSDKDGILYDNMSIKDLYCHWMGLAKKWNDPNLSQDAKDAIGMKISAICAILWDRKENRMLERNNGRPDPFVKQENIGSSEKYSYDSDQM